MPIAGSFFIAVKSADGSVWMWGLASSGQLGDNTITNRSSPVSVVGAHSFTTVAGGQNNGLGLKSADGSAWAWGLGTSGQPGDNTATSKSSPVSVVGAHSFSVISGGANSSLALKANDGSAWAWGTSASGQVGDNTITNRSSPVSVVGAHSFSAISGGNAYSLALKSDNGSAWAWGLASSGQLGDNTITNRSSPVSVIGAHSFTAISTENSASLALKGGDGSAWAWGLGTSGQPGDNTATSKSSPVSVVGAHSFSVISGGGNYGLALKSDNGSAWAWGNNSIGQLGDNTGANRSSPVSVVGAHSFSKISTGSSNSYALKSDGSVWAWGTRLSGAIGNNESDLVASPVSVVGAHSFNAISGGTSFSLALKSNDGSIWTWGLGNNGQLGDNTIANKSSPVSVVGAHSFSAISAGSQSAFSLALKSNDGSTWAWGLGGGGRLGDNTVANKSSPVSVVGAHSFNIIVAGTSHSLAVKSSDGSAWAWGFGTSGQLGDNTILSKSSPISVVGAHSFSSISAGNTFLVALKGNDGSIWAWGLASSGQLGDNTITNRSSPVSVVGAHSFSSISAGIAHNLALKGNDGSAWAWGNGGSGRLGDNAAANRSSPVSVVGAHSFSSISAGNLYTLGLKGNDGSAWAWGNGGSGQLGDNTLTNKSSPISVVGAHSFIQVRAADIDSYGLKADGSVWSWGARTSGALGDNTSEFLASPVQVVQPTTAIKTINGLAYAKYIYNDITTGSITVTSVKTVNSLAIASVKAINTFQ